MKRNKSLINMHGIDMAFFTPSIFNSQFPIRSTGNSLRFTASSMTIIFENLDREFLPPSPPPSLPLSLFRPLPLLLFPLCHIPKPQRLCLLLTMSAAPMLLGVTSCEALTFLRCLLPCPVSSLRSLACLGVTFRARP